MIKSMTDNPVAVMDYLSIVGEQLQSHLIDGKHCGRPNYNSGLTKDFVAWYQDPNSRQPHVTPPYSLSNFSHVDGLYITHQHERSFAPSSSRPSVAL